MSNSTAKKLNNMLQGERAAAETYKQALSKLGTDPRADGLREIQSDHSNAVSELEPHIKIRGDEPEQSSGPWGGFARTVMGTAKIFGDTAALKALKEGEEHGLKQYKDIVEDREIESSVRTLVRQKMIPKQKAHIRKINQIMSLVD